MGKSSPSQIEQQDNKRRFAKLQMNRHRAIVAILCLLAVGAAVIFWDAAIRASAFSNRGNIQISVIDATTRSGIGGAYVQIRAAKSTTNCPTSAGTTEAPSGNITFVGCPAWGGKAKYKLISVSAPDYDKEGSSSYRAAKNGFYLNVKGRKGARRIAKVVIYLVHKGSPKPSTLVPLPPRDDNKTKQAQNMQAAAASVAVIGFEEDTVERVNAERKKRGLGTLTLDLTLRKAARGHSYEMAAYCYFEHVSPYTGDFNDRLRAAGFDMNAHSTRGENIYMGSENLNTPYEAMQSWLHSAGHKENMLRPQFTRLGIGWINQDDIPKDKVCRGSKFNIPGSGFVTNLFSN